MDGTSTRWKPGVSGNPGGRRKGHERAAQEEADSWAEARGITGPHAGLRAAMRVAFDRLDDPKVDDRDRIGYLKFVVERIAGKPREIIEVDDQPSMTDEEYAEECEAIMRERLASLSADERLKLLADPVPTATVQ